MVFERFMELVMPPGGELFGRVIYIPGNHDHHLWELARESQYVNYISKHDRTSQLPVPWHTTKLFVEKTRHPVSSFMLTRLVKSSPGVSNFDVRVAYPNFGLVTRDGRRCVIFHHGHFIESLYLLMSRLRVELLPEREFPRLIYDLEAENYAWIEFIWSLLGRSGLVGRTVESVYERMHDRERFEELLAELAKNLAKRYGLPKLFDKLEAGALRAFFSFLAEGIYRMEWERAEEVLSEDAREGLRSYIEGPLRGQIITERREGIPFDVSFVFGHTHKPLEEDLDFEGYPRWMNVYNTGGWTISGTVPRPVFGASIVLADEKLNLASLRCYNEGAASEMRVAEALHRGEEPNPLYKRLETLIDPSADLWRSFSSTIAETLAERAAKMRERISRTK
jgi:hypothetical protein